MMPLLFTVLNYKDFKKYRDELDLLTQYFCNKKNEKAVFCYSFETKSN